MPGFTSFLLGHGRGQHPSQNFRTTTSFDHDSEAELDYDYLPPAPPRLQQARRHAAQVTSLYGTTMTHTSTSLTLSLLQALHSSISARIEDFHDMGLMSQAERRGAIVLFSECMQQIYQAGSVAVHCGG